MCVCVCVCICVYECSWESYYFLIKKKIVVPRNIIMVKFGMFILKDGYIDSINRIQDSSETKHFHVILLHIAFLVQNLKLWQPFCPCVFPLVEDGLSACVEFFSYSRFDGRECIENKFLSLSKFCGCFYSIHL